jgi:cytochrome b subunit of formate dehydrogenase
MTTQVQRPAVPAPGSAHPGPVDSHANIGTHAAHARGYVRFTLSQRIEHILLLLSFTILSITGVPQLFVGQDWAVALINGMGGIEFIRIVHRVAAVVLMLETIYHGGVVTYKVFVTRVRLTMLPTWKDVTDGIQSLGYNLGLAKTRPAMGRYNFGEKLEYWAVIWGTVIMVITGFMLWNPIATTNFLPGQVIPAAKAAHGGEALLAVLSIVTWHMYHVHVRTFNRSMFTGRLPLHEMEEEHGLELAELRAGITEPPIDPAVLRRRQRAFFPIAVLISVTLLTGLYFFVTYEQTAITTVPRQETESFVPATTTPSPE